MAQEYFSDRIETARRRHNALTDMLQLLQEEYSELHPGVRHNLHAAGSRAAMLLICASVLGRNRSDPALRIICMKWLAEYHHADDVLRVVEWRVQNPACWEHDDFEALVDQAEDQIRIAQGSLKIMHGFVEELGARHNQEVIRDRVVQMSGSTVMMRDRDERLEEMVNDCMDVLCRVKEGVSLKSAVEGIVGIEQA